MKHITSANSWNEFERSLEPLGKTEKGRAFEELTRLHLLTDPTFSTKIKEIWHHSDVPQKIVDQLGLQRPEIGVDLVAQVKDGTYWTIQCKFHQDRTKNVTYDELSTFFSITERDKTYPKLSHRLVCTSAIGISHRVGKAHPKKLGYLTSAEFSALGKEQFDAFRKLLSGVRLAPEPFDPRPHQKTALENVEKFFNEPENTRGKIIHPCGSGKSLTGYWIAQALKSQTVLIAVPSLALVRQTLGSWTREAVANNVDMDWIAVCSDDDVKNSDDPSMNRVDLGIEVDTDPEVIASFLSKRSKGIKVLITTYQSSLAVTEGVKVAETVFDLGVYDEAHKTVGQKDKAFAHLLYDENVKVKKRVFMTATERQFKGNSDEYLSMDDESIYGKVIHELSFKAALEQDPPILSDYKIVSTIVTKSEIEQLINKNDFVKSDGTDWSVEGDASTIAGLISLRKLVNERGIKHVVSFHRSIKRSKEFMNLNAEASKADCSFGELSSFHVSGNDSTGVRAAVLDRFVDAEPSLITNARCLTEGVDVPAIDAVLFADPKQSKIDIVQAAGRACRKIDGKDFGYIIIPVVLDEEASDPSDKAFEQIITVISALGMNDERIIEEFKQIAKGKTDGRYRIVDFDVPEIVRVKFEDFISNVEIKIWDRLSYGWVRGYEELKKYIDKYGDAIISARFQTEGGFRLGGWVHNRRVDYSKGRLSQDQINELETLKSWVWSENDYKFVRAIEYLKTFIADSHHARVTQNYKTNDGFKLGQWVVVQRSSYNRGKLSDDKKRQLKEIPEWTWDPLLDDFQNALALLQKYADEHNHITFPRNYKKVGEIHLPRWVAKQRQKYKKLTLPKKQIESLEAVRGWVWDPNADDFDASFSVLKKYVHDHGSAKVSGDQEKIDGICLRSWVGSQRKNFRERTLSKERVQKLETIPGWVWDRKKSEFFDALEKVKAFVSERGHARVPGGHITADGIRLGPWVSNRRADYRKGRLSREKVDILEKIPGWTWDPFGDAWEQGFEYLKEYLSKHEGNFPVANFITQDGFKLGQWIAVQKSNEDKMSSSRFKLLNNLEGWEWKSLANHG